MSKSTCVRGSWCWTATAMLAQQLRHSTCWGSHLCSHALGSSGGRACLWGLHGLPLGNIMGFVLLVLGVRCQTGLLQTLEIKQNAEMNVPSLKKLIWRGFCWFLQGKFYNYLCS
jgi:hypothetical protein